MPAWLSVWSEVQMICIRSSWCNCHPIISCFIKIQNSLPFWCRFTQDVQKEKADKRVSTRNTKITSDLVKYEKHAKMMQMSSINIIKLSTNCLYPYQLFCKSSTWATEIEIAYNMKMVQHWMNTVCPGLSLMTKYMLTFAYTRQHCKWWAIPHLLPNPMPTSQLHDHTTVAES